VPESFLALASSDRAAALDVAASRSGRPAHLLEKDVWVVWTLQTLYAASFADALVFKGGTSLSKAYQAIDRFSEDVDLTYDIRAIAPDLTSAGDDSLPPSRSQEQRWTKTIRERLAAWTRDTVAPLLVGRLQQEGLGATVSTDADTVRVAYSPATTGYGYVHPTVTLEFGARSTGEPHEMRDIECDAAPHLPDLAFPNAAPSVMRPERTFWEKATAIHVFCRGGRFRGAEHFSRHWYDIVALDATPFAEAALRDRDLAQRVARHKSMFFREKDAQGQPIDYDAAVRGGLQLVPDGTAARLLADDYAAMIADGLFFGEVPTFAALLEQCEAIQRRANHGGPW